MGTVPRPRAGGKQGDSAPLASASTATAGTTLLGPAELSELLGIPEKTLANWRSQRRGPLFLRIGAHVRYRLLDVEQWLEERAAVGRDWMVS